VLSEPSVVAIDERTGEVVAVGADAQRMIGRTPAQISATRPLRHGVIADFEVTEQMLRHFMRKVLDHRRAPSAPRRVRAVGHHRGRAAAVEEAALSAGARRVQLIEEPIAAPSAPASPSASRSGGWSSTSAAAPARWRSSPWGHRPVALGARRRL
jgi:rod shape-determining protein MreB